MDKIAPRVVRLRLAPLTGTVRPYRAGQFLFVSFNIPGVPRGAHPYSICCPPGNNHLEIMVKASDDRTLALYDKAANFYPSQPGQAGTQSPGSEQFANARPWTALVDYPYGNFTSQGIEPGPWVFLAAGIGIAPFLAMAGDRLRDDARILILWAAHNREELAGFDHLAAINARRPSVRLIPILGHDPLWTGRSGRLDDRALADLAGTELADPDTHYWICCPAPLQKALSRSLKVRGVTRKNIHREVFF